MCFGYTQTIGSVDQAKGLAAHALVSDVQGRVQQTACGPNTTPHLGHLSTLPFTVRLSLLLRAWSFAPQGLAARALAGRLQAGLEAYNRHATDEMDSLLEVQRNLMARERQLQGLVSSMLVVYTL